MNHFKVSILLFTLAAMYGCVTPLLTSSHIKTPITSSPTLPGLDKKKKHPLSFEYYYILAERALIQGKVEESVDNYVKALKLRPRTYRLYTKLLSLFVANGLFKQTQLLLDKLPDEFRSRRMVRYLQASLFVASKKIGDAIQLLDGIIDDFPGYESAYLLLAEIYELKKDDEKKITVLKLLLKNIPTSFIAEKRLGLHYQMKDQLALAQHYLLSALEKNDKDLNLYVSLGYLFEKLGKQEVSLEYFETALSYNKNNILLLEKIANSYIRLGNGVMALKLLLRLNALLPNNNDIKLKIALLYYELEEYHKAEKILSLFIQDPKSSDQIFYYYGVVLEYLKNYQKSMKFLTKIPVKSDYYSGALVHQVRILRALNRVDEAQALLIGKEQFFSDLAVYYEMRASIYADKSDYALAIEELTIAKEKIGGKARLLFLMGMYYDRWGKRSECIEVLKQVISIVPTYAAALNYLGYLFVEEGVFLDQAEMFIKSALKEDPANGYYLDSLGWLFYKKGDPKKAIHFLQLALSQYPNESVILNHLGTIYAQKGLAFKAVEYFKKAIQFETDYKELKSLIYRVETIKVSIE